MGVEKKEVSAESRDRWLDEELRQTKAGLQKVEHELEQALNQLWNLGSGLRKLEENSGDRDGVAAALSAVREEMRQLRGQADRFQERQNALAERTEDMGRQQQSEIERERQERAGLLKQAETALRAVGQFDSRVQRLEEALRHVEEAVSEARLSQQTLGRDIEELTNRSARNLETALRLERELGAFASEVEALHKRDGEIDERVSLYEEKTRLGDERINKFEADLTLTREIKEALDRARFERQQLTERLGKIESSAGRLLESTAEFVQGLARVDQRTQNQATHLMELAEELKQQRETVFDQMRRMVRTMERQRRRQAEALAQEIKELSRSEFKDER